MLGSALRALVGLNGPNQAHLGPPPLCPGTPLKLRSGYMLLVGISVPGLVPSCPGFLTGCPRWTPDLSWW